MTADFDSLPDLEEYDTMYKGYIDYLGVEMNESNLSSSPYKKPPPVFDTYSMCGNSLMDIPSSYMNMEWESPTMQLFGGHAEETLGFTMNDFNNALIHSENESDFLIVNPISMEPTPVKDSEEDEEKDDFVESLESVLAEDLMDLTDEKLIKIVDSNFMNCSNLVTLDDILMRPPKRFTHLDFDHSYSIRPEGYEYDECYNSPPSPSSSSCSEKTTKRSKRGRPPKKATASKKIKQEPCYEEPSYEEPRYVLPCFEEPCSEEPCSEDDEVDVESPYTTSLLVPKITLALSPPPSPPTPPKRGRKPKNKSQGQGQKNKKNKNKNYQFSPKILEEAIKQQKKKNYVTKSGRVTKLSHSVESTPSTSTQSSQSSSRCSSDNEDTADKRASHNQAERQRRQQLTDLFQNLRKRIPTLISNPKASKVAILTDASKFVLQLEDTEKMKKLCKEQSKSEAAKKLSILQSLMSSS